MKSMKSMKNMLLLFVMAVAVVVAGCDHKTSASTPLPAMPQGNKAPSKQFVEEWRDYDALRKEVADIQKKESLAAKIDQLNGAASRLRSQIPQGYDWDEDTLSFKPLAQAQPAPPQTAAPAAKK